SLAFILPQIKMRVNIYYPQRMPLRLHERMHTEERTIGNFVSSTQYQGPIAGTQQLENTSAKHGLCRFHFRSTADDIPRIEQQHIIPVKGQVAQGFPDGCRPLACSRPPEVAAYALITAKAEQGIGCGRWRWR